MSNVYPVQSPFISPGSRPDTFSDTYEKMRKWSETSEYELVDEGYILEIYNTQQDLNENYVVEIWKEVKK